MERAQKTWIKTLKATKRVRRDRESDEETGKASPTTRKARPRLVSLPSLSLSLEVVRAHGKGLRVLTTLTELSQLAGFRELREPTAHCAGERWPQRGQIWHCHAETGPKRSIRGPTAKVDGQRISDDGGGGDNSGDNWVRKYK
ncbi:hypothetical protein CRG98_034284 [Punica granatum]|uniref:Uncharacterized protein n=1 Tax=Punica granatum TaxID=22663 RepID=A0A2I0INN1_PUNGR|nr:hypothetical protein CRG98_034284 [Punica granatum]